MLKTVVLAFSIGLFLTGCGKAGENISFGNSSTAGSSTSGTSGASVVVGTGSASGASSASSVTGSSVTGGATTGTATSASSATGTSSSSSSAASSSSSTTSGLKVWTVAQILSEPRRGGSGGEAKCGGEGGFKRCLCPADVPADVRYRPAVKECNGHAAIILSGSYEGVFSVVVRNSQNADRYPPAGSGFGGCTRAQADAGFSRCSAFKVQEEFSVGGGTARVLCLGASGYSTLFSDVTRITAKLENDNTSSDDPLERFCIYGPTRPLN